MKRYLALLKNTWWLWIVFFGTGIGGMMFVDGAFFAMIPISVFTFFYFAHVRYDDDGTRR